MEVKIDLPVVDAMVAGPGGRSWTGRVDVIGIGPAVVHQQWMTLWARDGWRG